MSDPSQTTSLVAAPPWSALGRKLESTVRKALYTFGLLDDVTDLAIALSGGKDSMALLFLLHTIAGRGFPRLNLTAVHVAGRDSCGASVSTEYLDKVCRALDVCFVSVEDGQEHGDCYGCARARRKLIFDAARERGIGTVAFGHHRDDSVQTLLMNLLHKGEFAGNLPKVHMLKYGMTIIRPLIYVSEMDIRSFARMYGFERITCQCLRGQHSKRKQTEGLLEMMERDYPHARSNIARAIHAFGSNKAATP
ncbi:MAG: tRNA 2-thiocytidine biosynthesis TtcA family protein [Proteobacteria bacterium]|nr:tRNA 2-thiocytidine biosynthesis TtcA family protein [Pseudomonadota bacterium]